MSEPIITHAERLALSGMLSICARDWGAAIIEAALVIGVLAIGGLIGGVLIEWLPSLPHWGGFL